MALESWLQNKICSFFQQFYRDFFFKPIIWKVWPKISSEVGRQTEGATCQGWSGCGLHQLFQCLKCTKKKVASSKVSSKGTSGTDAEIPTYVLRTYNFCILKSALRFSSSDHSSTKTKEYARPKLRTPSKYSLIPCISARVYAYCKLIG